MPDDEPFANAVAGLDADGNDGGDSEVLAEIRHAQIASELRARESRLCVFENLRVVAATWNVNSSLPPSDLSAWLRPETLNGGERPGLYFIGLQEVSVSADTLLYGDVAREAAWCDAIAATLSRDGGDYTKLFSRQLGSLLLVVFARADVAADTGDVGAAAVGTGLLGLGNKGGLAVRLCVRDTYYTCVNAHLAADLAQVERRNQDYGEIARRSRFALGETYDEWTWRNPWVPTWRERLEPLCDQHSSASVLAAAFSASGRTRARGRAANVGLSGSEATLFDTDHLVWLGDLNYRLALPDADVRARIAAGAWSELWEHDQLREQQRSGLAFAAFCEGPLSFAPTYKYDVGTRSYDTSEKKRVPSWCDRVLWFQPCGAASLQLVGYKAVDALTVSDHRPVVAVLDTTVRRVDRARLAEAQHAITRELDRDENESTPALELEGQSVHFAAAAPYGVLLSATVTLHNRGRVPATWWLARKPGDTAVCKRWLWPEPRWGLVRPGEDVRLQLGVQVDAASAAALNLGRDTLDDVLVLHIQRGRDHFVTVQAPFVPSSFGLALDVQARLAARADAVASLTPEQLSAAATDAAAATIPAPGKVPPVLWRLVDLLYRFGNAIDNLFLLDGDPDVEAYLRRCLDTGTPFDVAAFVPEDRGDPALANCPRLRELTVESDEQQSQRMAQETAAAIQKPPSARRTVSGLAHAAAAVLLEWLRALPEPVLPYDLQPAALRIGGAASPSFETALGLVQGPAFSARPQLAAHRVAWTYLVTYLKDYCSRICGPSDALVDAGSVATGAADRLAAVFAPVLLRPAVSSSDSSTPVDPTARPVQDPRTSFLALFLRPVFYRGTARVSSRVNSTSAIL